MRRLATAVAAAVLVAGGVSAGTSGARGPHPDVLTARKATANFHDVTKAQAAGYASTENDLGCFENAELGGMGLHFLKGTLLDGVVDAAQPEALVYEWRENLDLKLVGHEYIVPEAFVDPADPPELFGQQFHKHPTLPLWVLHTWIWRPNPDGMFADYNPAVRMCPDGIRIFGS